MPHGNRKPHDFSRANVRAGVEQSLHRMKTDYLDVVQFHVSPSREVLEKNDSVAELLKMKEEGKLRFIGISGTIPELKDHIAVLYLLSPPAAGHNLVSNSALRLWPSVSPHRRGKVSCLFHLS